MEEVDRISERSDEDEGPETEGVDGRRSYLRQPAGLHEEPEKQTLKAAIPHIV